MNLRGNRYLVTGGAGFIGSHICEELLGYGKEVICIDNLVSGHKENVQEFLGDSKFTFVEADICNYDAIKDYFHGVDTVFHNAASKCTVCRDNPYLDLQVNAMGAWNVFEASWWGHVRRVVHASTGSVYGEMTHRQDESHPFKPVSFYGVSKLAGERYLEAFKNYYQLGFSIIRYYHVFGPRQEDADHGGVIPIFIRRALRNEPLLIYGNGSQVRSFTYVKDDVKANLVLAEADQADGEAYNCASGMKMSIQELAELIIRRTSSRSRIHYKNWRLGDIKNFDVKNDKIKKLGVKFSDFDECLNETIRWYKTKYAKA